MQSAAHPGTCAADGVPVRPAARRRRGPDRPGGRRQVRRLAAIAPADALIPRLVTADPAEGADFFAEALARGHEGVVVKSVDSAYGAGRRGGDWIKVKPRTTLDLVILGAEWGHGRRTGWLSNLHLGARDPETGGFVMLGKTFKGLTDAMLTWQTERLLALAEQAAGQVRCPAVWRGQGPSGACRGDRLRRRSGEPPLPGRRDAEVRAGTAVTARTRRPPRPTRSTWFAPSGRTRRRTASPPEWQHAPCHDLSMRTLWLDEDGTWHTKLRGRQILNDPRLNRGTAFSYPERHDLGITGLVPPAHVTLDQQVATCLRAISAPAR